MQYRSFRMPIPPPPSHALISLRRGQQLSSTPWYRTGLEMSYSAHSTTGSSSYRNYFVSNFSNPTPSRLVLDTPTYLPLYNDSASRGCMCVCRISFIFNAPLTTYKPFLSTPAANTISPIQHPSAANSRIPAGILEFSVFNPQNAPRQFKSPYTTHVAPTQTWGTQALPAQKAQATGQVRSYSGR